MYSIFSKKIIEKTGISVKMELFYVQGQSSKEVALIDELTGISHAFSSLF